MPQSCVKQVASTNMAPWEEGEKILWKTKSIHGMYHWQTGEMADTKKSYQWLERLSLERSLPEQTGPRVQTVQSCPSEGQIAAECTMQAATMYTNRHNQIKVTVYICGEYGLPIPNSQRDTPQREV